MIIAQSAAEDIPVVTSDPAFRDYHAKIVW